MTKVLIEKGTKLYFGEKYRERRADEILDSLHRIATVLVVDSDNTVAIDTKGCREALDYNYYWLHICCATHIVIDNNVLIPIFRIGYEEERMYAYVV